MIITPRLLRHVLMLVCAFCVCMPVAGQFRLHPSPFVPEQGTSAVERLGRDLVNTAVVLNVALEPGTEDAATLAYLRLVEGVRVVTAYVSNGGGIPPADRTLPPLLLAAQRREEAFRAMSTIGAEAYFLAMPDAPIANDSMLLAAVWPRDSLQARLTTAIRVVRPDVIIIGRDVWSQGGDSPRQRYVRSALEGSVRSLRGEWEVLRIVVDAGETSSSNRYIPPIARTSREAASAAIGGYVSLKLQTRSWHTSASRAYRTVYPRVEPQILRKSIVDGLTLHSKRLGGVSSAVRNAVKATQTLSWSRALAVVTTAIDSVQRRIFLEGERLEPRDRRTLVSWKLGLEQLRCVVLDVRFSLEVSDSMLTGSQLFFFRVKGFSARDTAGPTYFMLPAMRKDQWIVNEAQESAYPVAFPSEFRVITPETLQVTSGPAAGAVLSPRARFPLSLILYHDHPDRTKNFEYRIELPLRIASKHVFELLTPIVRAHVDTRVAYTVTNVSRDRLPATVSIVDSLVHAGPRPLLLRVKDEVVTDTLALEYRGPLPAEDYPVEIRVGRRRAARFVARTFSVERDTTLRVGVLTAFRGDAVIAALERTGIPNVIVQGPGDPEIERCNVIIVDRDALALIPGAAAVIPRLERWVAGGGHLIIFPHWYGATNAGSLTRGITFAADGGVDVATPLRLDSSVALQPNRLASKDMEGWVISRAFGTLSLPHRSFTTVLVADDRGRPLVARFRTGEGTVLVSSLDLQSQLLNVHPGAHRLFVNLLACH